MAEQQKGQAPVEVKLEPTEANAVEITREALEAFARQQNFDFGAGNLKLSDLSQVTSNVNEGLGHAGLQLFDENMEGSDQVH